MDDEFFDLVEWEILHDIVDSPWTIAYLEISTFCERFWEFGDFFIELIFIGFVFDFFDKITRIMSLGTESIDDAHTSITQYLTFWHLRCKSISSLREDDL